jgi:hypothetical protein
LDGDSTETPNLGDQITLAVTRLQNQVFSLLDEVSNLAANLCLKHHKQFQQQNAFEGEQALDYPAGALPALLQPCSQTIAAVSQAKRFEESSLLMPLIRSSLDE